MSGIVERLKRYYAEHPQAAQSLPSPASPAIVQAAEAKLGFRLPEVLRELYLSLANGGFGPDIIGLEGGYAEEDGLFLPELYVELLESEDPEDPDLRWPPLLLPFADYGCGSYVCLDCSQPQAPVIGFDPNVYNPEEGKVWSDTFLPERDSLDQWLAEWLEYPYSKSIP